jgi:RNA polymerase sigma-54 factor
MTPQLRQAIKLLQYSNVEVGAFVEEELERNPLLERDERPESAPEQPAPDQIVGLNGHVVDAVEMVRSDLLAPDASAPLDVPEAASYDPGGIADGAPVSFVAGRSNSADFSDDARDVGDLAETRRSLREHLGEQLRLTFSDLADRMIGAHLIALLDATGRLTARPADIADAMAVTLERLEAVRAVMMQFDPVGLFAVNLRECLAAQLAERNRLDPAMATLLDNLELLARRDTKRLLALCGVDAEDLVEMIGEIRALNPKPGAGFDIDPVQTVVPDLLMRAGPDRSWIIELNPDTLPRVLVNERFYARVMPRAAKEDRAFLAERLASANWLVKSLQQRSQTILKVASEIVQQQDAFFRHGVSHLRPLILRDIAALVEIHESTVSRVTANKYIATPRGTFELKYFFTTAIPATGGREAHSAEAVRHRIRALISGEAPAAILSDDAIVEALRQEGVDIARRTVAKYREALRIPNSAQRKREKAVPA